MHFTTSLSEEEANNFFEVELDTHHGTASRLAKEGVERPEDSIEFNYTSVETTIGSLRRRGRRAPDKAVEGRVALV